MIFANCQVWPQLGQGSTLGYRNLGFNRLLKARFPKILSLNIQILKTKKPHSQLTLKHQLKIKMSEDKKEEVETKEEGVQVEMKEKEAAAEETPKKKKKESKKSPAAKKRLSALQRKKQDPRYYLNGKGRYVSKKKSENGKKNVQSRAIRLARKGLGIKGMVLVGKGEEGKKLLNATSAIRQMLKDGKSDDEAEAMLAGLISDNKL